MVDCNYLAGALETGVMVAPEVDGLVGFAVAQGALQAIHRQFINNSIWYIYHNRDHSVYDGQNYMQKQNSSTIDLHNIKDQIYLGFLAQQNLDISAASHQLSYFGGDPLWLTQPTEAQQKCGNCNVSLCFMGQMYCPFNADHCYHRILYFLFCSKCNREFRCIRQQAEKSWAPTQDIKTNVRKVCPPRELENDSYSRADFIKLQSRLKIQIEEEEAIEQAESEEEQDVMTEVNNQAVEQLAKNEAAQQEKEQEGRQEQKQKLEEQMKDHLFEVYKKAIVQLDCPCAIYTDTPLPYNKRPLNPQHFCKCGSKLVLEVQLTQKILNLDNDPDSRLLLMDWGSIFVYTCSSSCGVSSEECVVVQYQIDAVSEEDIKKLNKNKKNKKKKQKKSKSKSKSKEKQEKDKESEEEQTTQQNENQGKEEGDWD